MDNSYTFGDVTVTEQEVAQHMVAAVKTIFSTMIFIDDIVEDYPLEKPVSHFHCSISGMVGLGGAFSGMVGIHLPEDFAQEATASMLGMTVEEVDAESDINDAVGEITNMLAGEVKMLFSDKNLHLCLSTPSIISGKDYTIEVMNNNCAVIVPFYRGEQRFIATLQISAS